jgi:putative transposase
MNTYFVSTNIDEFRNLLQSERSANLFINVLFHYRDEGNYLVHEFVVMPDHVHLIISPTGITLERSMQSIKGGFSFRARKEFHWQWKVWHKSFHDRRLRDHSEYVGAREYVLDNPVRAHLCSKREDWPYSSANPRFELDRVPQWLKPSSSAAGSHA